MVAFCVVTVRICLQAVNSKEEFLSFDRKHIIAEIFDALVICDGQLSHFEEQKFPDIKPAEFQILMMRWIGYNKFLMGVVFF